MTSTRVCPQVLLDGSASRDPDDPDGLAHGALQYAWGCRLLALAPPAPGAGHGAGDTACRGLTLPKRAVVNLSASTLLPLRTYRFTLTVSVWVDQNRTSTSKITNKTVNLFF